MFFFENCIYKMFLLQCIHQQRRLHQKSKLMRQKHRVCTTLIVIIKTSQIETKIWLIGRKYATILMPPTLLNVTEEFSRLHQCKIFCIFVRNLPLPLEHVTCITWHIWHHFWLTLFNKPMIFHVALLYREVFNKYKSTDAFKGCRCITCRHLDSHFGHLWNQSSGNATLHLDSHFGTYLWNQSSGNATLHLLVAFARRNNSSTSLLPLIPSIATS